MTDEFKKMTYNLVAAGVAMLAAKVVQSGIEKGWEAVQKDEPPENPDDPETSWKEALIWSVATGVLIGLTKLLAKRGTAAGWSRIMGYNPTRLT